VTSELIKKGSEFKNFYSPKTLATRFTVKRTFKTAIIFSSIIGFYMYIKASSFITTYPTPLARLKLANTLGSNIGIEALLGTAHHIETITGYLTWNFLCLVTAAGAIWGLLLATKIFRGEEDSGRQEILLTGQTTPRKSAINTIIGLGTNLSVIFIIFSLSIMAIGTIKGANFSTGSSLFLSLSLTLGAAEFLVIGALTSQLMSIRSRAIGLSTAIFGVFYMLRLIADTTSERWLLNLSPLGWIEKLQPMFNSKPIWLLPIGLFILLGLGLTIYFAGKRDLGTGVLTNKDSARAHTRLLNSALGVSIRMNRVLILGWLITIGFASFIYGTLAKNTIVSSLSNSKVAKTALDKLSQQAKPSAITSEAFLGITFFLVMIMMMFFVASIIGRMREEEAEGFLDNFLVRSVSRFKWLSGRIGLIFVSILVIGLVGSIATWGGESSQHAGIALHTLLIAGANAIIPAGLILGIGVFIFGWLPRMTSVFTYGVIAWSFLIEMLNSGVNLNHWILDSSIFYHIRLAPALNPNWSTNELIIVISLVFILLGAFRFNSRDLRGE
jgi:ABC-2 type transport system permease protein